MSSIGVESSDGAVETHSDVRVGVAVPSPNESAHRGDGIEEAQLFLDLATDFRTDGWFDKARRFARRALSIFERQPGTDPRDIVRALLCIAGARENLRDHIRAEAEYRRASDVLDRLPESADTLDVQALRIETLRGLASVKLALGRDQQAEATLRQALDVARHIAVSKPSDVATILDDLGLLCRRAGRLAEASRLHYRALAIIEQALSAEHPLAGTILYHLGILEYARGRLSAGEAFARRAVAIRQKTFGPDHPQVAAVFVSLGVLLSAQRKYSEAKLVDEYARMILERWFGQNHSDVAATGGRLAARQYAATRSSRPSPGTPALRAYASLMRSSSPGQKTPPAIAPTGSKRAPTPAM
jgi:tetratricopeptide (TPR) repeat protein